VNDPGLNARILLDNVLQRVALNDAVIVLVKAVVGGLIIGLYSIYYGSRMEGRLRGITSAMAKATTRQFVLVFAVNVVLTVLAYQQ
jgi:ABC-type transporter Mla maintaining outer membrane lipid asymmetry permease subunit MlaE